MSVDWRPDDPAAQEIARLTRALEQARAERDRAAAQRDQNAVRLEAERLRHAKVLGRQADRLAHALREQAADRGALVRLERGLEARRQSEGERLDRALRDSIRSWAGLLALPGKVLAMRRRLRRARRRGTGPEGRPAGWLDRIEAAFDAEGLAAAERLVASSRAPGRERAAALVRLAKRLADLDPATARRLGADALDLDPKAAMRKWFGFLLFNQGAIAEADELLHSLPADTELRPSEIARVRQAAGLHRLSLQMPFLPERREEPACDPLPGRVLYLGASALPHNISGYTVRSQAMVTALAAAGWTVVCATRPGYPDDRPDAVMAGGRPGADAPSWEALPGPHRRKTGLDHYLAEAADIVEARCRELRPALIHAASNHEVAIPALIAARRLGIPFVYEVRGLWELTASSSRPGWEETERFALDVRLETFAAANADAVLTLTGALADELSARGVDRARITLAPNAVDPLAWSPRPRDHALAAEHGLAGAGFTVGYLGSIVGYEGLDDLLRAVALLRERGLDARALIVGDGDALGALRLQAEAAGLGGAVVFAGRVPPHAVPAFLSLLDAVALPRKPLRVCEMVSPLKPLEAMAAEVPVVVSDVRALREMVEDGITGSVHRAGDAASLADALERLARDPQHARALAGAARRTVMRERTWAQVALDVGTVYRKLLPAYHAAPADGRPAAPVPISLPAGRSGLDVAEKALLDERLRQAWQGARAPGVETFLQAQITGRRPRFAAFCMLRAAHVLAGFGDDRHAALLVERATATDHTTGTCAGAARFHLAVADYERAAADLGRLAASGAGDDALAAEIDGHMRLVAAVHASRASARGDAATIPNRILSMLAFSLPHSSVGYATRSHGLALGLKRCGWDMRLYTRPGFPEEPQGPASESDEVDGIVYRRLAGHRRGVREVAYLQAAADTIERVIVEDRPAIVHAASNYVTALPALIAARRRGVPFVYEVRGFWDLTRSVRDAAFEHSPKGRTMRFFEGLVAREADRVITITEAMREELVARGVAPERITLVPNSVDAARFVPRPRDEALAARFGLTPDVPVIGYVGSVLDYEGLDDLAAAAAALRDEGLDFRLLVVGDGAALAALRSQIDALGLDDRTILAGRVPHEEVEAYYSLIDVAPFPRKPLAVCEIVSPLKPFEAMALRKAVVVSSTRALAEIVEDGVTGVVFAKGDRAALRVALATLLTDGSRRASLGAAAREWVLRERCWDAAATRCAAVYLGVRGDDDEQR